MTLAASLPMKSPFFMIAICFGVFIKAHRCLSRIITPISFKVCNGYCCNNLVGSDFIGCAIEGMVNGSCLTLIIWKFPVLILNFGIGEISAV